MKYGIARPRTMVNLVEWYSKPRRMAYHVELHTKHKKDGKPCSMVYINQKERKNHVAWNNKAKKNDNHVE